MTHCQRVRGCGATIALAQGGLSLKGAKPEVIAYAKKHKADILAELAREQASPTYRLSKALWSMREEIDRIYGTGGDKAKCMTLFNLIDSVLIEEDDQKEFFATLRRISSDAINLVRDIEGNRLLEGKELAAVASRVFTDKPTAAPKTKLNQGAFA